MAKTFNTRVQQKIDTENNWIAQDPVLLNGEIVIAKTEFDEMRIKIGDGTSTFSSLPYIDDATNNSLLLHTLNKNNPHSVTAQQIGAEVSGSAASALAEAKSYSDTNLAEAKSYSDSNLAEAKSYTDSAIGNINSILDTINGEVI